MEMLLAVAVMALCFVGLGLGLVLKRRKNCVQGSCGGEEAKNPNSPIACMTCSGDPEKCPEGKGDPARAEKSSGAETSGAGRSPKA